MKMIFSVLLLFIPVSLLSIEVTYYVYKGGSNTTFAIPSTIDDCEGNHCQICFKTEYYFTLNGSGKYTGSSYTFTSNRTPATYIVRLIKQVTRYSSSCDGTINSTQTIDTYTFDVIDFSWMSGSYNENCLEGAAVDLRNYINGFNTWFVASVSGAGVSGVYFTPSSAGVGTFTLTATKSFDNGTYSITKDFNVHKPDFTFSSLGQVCIDQGLIDVRSYVNVLPFTLSGTGVSGYFFNPSNAGAGTHTLSVTYTDGYGCSTTKTANVTVNSTFAISAGATFFLCNDAPSVSLVGDPSGGTWTGTGVIGSDFIPSSVSAGSYNLTYIVTQNSCTKSAVKAVTVYPLPDIDAGANLSVCQFDGIVSLNGSGVIPSDGNWTCSNSAVNSAINNTTKTLNVTGIIPNTYTLIYSKTSSESCTTSDTRTVTIKASPVINMGADIILCINAYPTGYNLLSDITPVGGSVSGTGVSGGRFYPSVAGKGQHTITYSYTAANGCSDTKTKNIIVKGAVPGDITVGAIVNVCVDGSEVDLNTYPNISGGTWSGTGVSNNKFYPNVAGVGTHNANYNLTFEGCPESVTKVFNVIAKPNTPTITGNQNVCLGNNVTLSVASSISGETYSWFVNGSAIPFATGNSTILTVDENKNVIVEATNTDGCISAVRGTLTVIAQKPNLIFEIPGSFCTDKGLVDLNSYVNIATGTVFSGTGVSGTIFNTNQGLGSYTITAVNTDTYGCSTTKTATATVKPTFTINGGLNLTVCQLSGDTPLSGSPVGGSWSGSGVISNSFNPASLAPEFYTLTYSVNHEGCIKEATKTVEVLESPVVNAGGDLSFCKMVGEINLNGSSISPSDGIWSCGNTFVNSLIDNMNKRINISSAQSGSYVLTYNKTLINGCSNYDQKTLIVLESPNIVFSKTSLQVCKNAYQTGYDLFQDVTPVTGTWTGEGVVGNKFFSNITGVGSFPLTYTVNNTNGCSQTRIIDINVVESLSGSLTLGAEIFICLNHTPVDLSTFPNISGGIWTGSGVTNGYFYPEISGTGRHLVTYTVNTAGCNLVASKYITVNSLPSIPIITGKTSVCKNEITTLTIENSNVNVYYKWFKDIETNYFSALTSVDYLVSHNETFYVSAVNSYGCRSMENGIVMLNIPSPEGVVTASKDSVYRGEVVQLLYSGTDGVSHSWNLGDGITVTTNNPYHYYYSLGLKDVKLTLTTVKGCSIDILKSGIVKVYDRSTGVDDVKNEGFLLYPSPFRSSLVIEFQSGVNRLEIFNIYGLKVFDKTFNQEKQISLEGLNFINGLYLVGVNGVYYSKVIKQ